MVVPFAALKSLHLRDALPSSQTLPPEQRGEVPRLSKRGATAEADSDVKNILLMLKSI